MGKNLLSLKKLKIISGCSDSCPLYLEEFTPVLLLQEIPKAWTFSGIFIKTSVYVLFNLDMGETVLLCMH